MASRPSNEIVGIRLPTDVIVDFKKEAAERNMRLNELFLEMWKKYRKPASKLQSKKK